MDFRDEKFLEILQKTTKTRESLGNFPFEIVLDDDRNYHNDECLLFMGDHSKVKKLNNKDGKSEFALKIIKISKIKQKTLEYFELIQNEIKFLKRLDHPNIIVLKDFFKDRRYFYIVYELAEFGNMLDYYRKTDTFTEDDVFQLFFQLLLAVDCLHRKGIIHRNLKLQNVLLDGQHNLKLSNFKYACEEHNFMKLNKDFYEENINYCPPEALLTDDYDKKFDIWGLGIVLYELITKTPPFSGIIIEHTIHNILSESTVIKGKLSESLKNLLGTLLSKDPKERPTTEDILRHQWILNNLPKYDLTFLKHPVFQNNHNLKDFSKYLQIDLSPSLKPLPEVRKSPMFGKVNSKHQTFLIRSHEEETQKYPNIFHDGYFDRSYTQKTLNKSFEKTKKFSQPISPYKQLRIFGPMQQPFQNHKLEDEEYDIVQHIKERHSLGDQEEQRFSHPVEIEKKKREKNTASPYLNASQKMYKSNDFHEKSQNYKSQENYRGKSNYYYNDNNNDNNNSHYNEQKSRVGNTKEDMFIINEMSRSNLQNDYSGYSGKSNNKGLYFDRDFSNKNLYI